ncbi:hypothetical protein SAMN05421783_1345 [Thiocapsa roseopersicina]|uniref:Uncharacterized protein n=1 Tax=Thiocapsa roseopersicina TaxID=1058 RepID=A0A1H3CGF4_THIRO|nr:hypothetical protein SAMN05421783_1345 [Thiocapsa roseopersicina]
MDFVTRQGLQVHFTQPCNAHHAGRSGESSINEKPRGPSIALDQKALQKTRAKRELKRRQTKPASAGLPGALSAARVWANVGRAPIADIFVPSNLFELGIGTVWVNRSLPDGRYAVAGILVDVFCLGVKNVLYKIVDAAGYSTVLARIRGNPTESAEARDPSCARKLVEDALAYAKDLGFEPHADYRIARLIFGDIDAGACPVSFTFGKDGKPFYIAGQNDTSAMQRRIVKRLESRCGPWAYDYLVMA